MFTTKKEARAAGLRTAPEWMRWRRTPEGETQPPLVPRRDATPVLIKGVEFFWEQDCEEIVSRTEASRRGLKVPDDVAPVAELHTQTGRSQYYSAYRLSDCKPKKHQNPAQTIDVLLAVFTVNKAAKRYRDNAQGHYLGRRHALARSASSRKRGLYALKEKGIIAACAVGRLTFIGIHGGLALYRGEGYCFHSCLAPTDVGATVQTLDSDSFFKEAAPKEASEARLKDAVLTLQSLSVSEDRFTRLPRPEYPRKERDQEPVLAHGESDDDEGDDDEEWDQFER